MADRPGVTGVRVLGRHFQLDRRLPTRRFASRAGGRATLWPWREFHVPFAGRLTASRITPRKEVRRAYR